MLFFRAQVSPCFLLWSCYLLWYCEGKVRVCWSKCFAVALLILARESWARVFGLPKPSSISACLTSCCTESEDWATTCYSRVDLHITREDWRYNYSLSAWLRILVRGEMKKKTYGYETFIKMLQFNFLFIILNKNNIHFSFHRRHTFQLPYVYEIFSNSCKFCN